MKINFKKLSLYYFLIVLCSCEKCHTHNYKSNKYNINKSELLVENFTSVKNEIMNSISSENYSLAERLINEIKVPENNHYYWDQLDELNLYLSEHKLFNKIKLDRKIEDIQEYQSNNKYKLYQTFVNEIEKDIIYQSFSFALEKNSENEYKFFLENFQENIYTDSIKLLLSNLLEKKYEVLVSEANTFNYKSNTPIIKYKSPDTYKSNIIEYNLPETNAANYTHSNYSQKHDYKNPNSNTNIVHVKGYYRSNGTYVEPYIRTAPNSTKSDNFNYKGW